MQFLDVTGVKKLWSRCKEIFATKEELEEISAGDSGIITQDIKDVNDPNYNYV